MGAGQSQNLVDFGHYGEEYKIKNSDVIQIQSILLGVQQSVSELQRRQDELKRVVLVQNQLFTEQNQLIKKFVDIIVDVSKKAKQEIPENSFTFSTNNNCTEKGKPSFKSKSGDSGSGHDENIDDDDNSENLYPVHTLSEVEKCKEITNLVTIESKNDRVPKKENTAIRVSANSGEGIRRLLVFDVTVILAKLTSANVEESANQLETLLLKGPVLNLNQFEIAASTILEKSILEPGRASVFVRLIQRVNVKLSTEHKLFWRKALVESYRKELNVSQELQLEANKLSETFQNIKSIHIHTVQPSCTADSDIISIAIDEKYCELQQQYFGIFNFICELFQNHMITPKDLMDVGDELLSIETLNNNTKVLNYDDEIAALNLHMLLQKTGISLHEILHQIKSKGCYEIGSKGNVITPIRAPNVHWLDTTFASIKKILDQKKAISPSLRHSLSRLLKLQETNLDSI